MSKKQKGRNAFYYFMLDWRKREEACGRKYESLKEVQSNSRCSDEWKNLAPHVKKSYETMAKKHKADSRGKMNNMGEPIYIAQMREREEAEFNENMTLYITTTINDGIKSDSLNKIKFYFIHFNWFYIVEDGQTRYVPAEYAIGEFSLEDGLERYHHKLVHIKPELGYAWEAMNTSKNSHKIPCELPQGEQNFHDLYVDLLEFLEPTKINGKYPPFFTGKKVYKGVPSLFNQLATAAGVENIFNVYSIELLFSKLHKAALAQYNIGENCDPIESNILEAVGESEFLKDKFAFAINIECDYHKNIDGTSPYCSLAVIRQWAFTFCDHCCEPFGINIKRGIHYPESRNFSDLATGIHSISLSSTQYKSVLSMEGVSEGHRIKVSERSEKDKQFRRIESKPLVIVDHTKKDEYNVSTPSTTLERPLRAPNTRSFAAVAATSKQNDIPDLSDTNFLSIGGRGVMLKKKMDINTLLNGRGYRG